LYGRQWRKARALFLAEQPLCAYCHREGRVTAATVVDHVTPHRGDPGLFWDAGNWQPLCKIHHDRVKQCEELGQIDGSAGFDGFPVSPNHPWNR
jgi:5-methylcytosine-specific restriction enzyme A